MIALQTALEEAEKIVTQLTAHTKKIHIAGSCRRKKPLVNDIEIICQPKRKMTVPLFGESTESDERTNGFVTGGLSLGAILKGSPKDGKYSRIKLHSATHLDLFMPNDHDYYRQLAIRTGSADYSWKVIANAWSEKGWCGAEHGLRNKTDCVKYRENEWRCVKENPELPPIWQSEEEFFDWIGVKWVEPSQRYA